MSITKTTKASVNKILAFLMALALLLSLVPAVSLTAHAEGKEYKVLYWCCENDYAQYSVVVRDFYSEIEGVTVLTKTSGALTEEDLNGIQLVYMINFSVGSDTIEGQNMVNAATLLKDFVTKGGRVVMNGEWNGFAGVGNATLSALAAAMGGNFTILDANSDEMTMTFNTDEKAELTNNLNNNFRPNAFAPIQSTNPDAIWVAKDAYDHVFVLDQKVENGYITAVSDVNWYYDGLTNSDVKDKAIQFLTNLLVDSAQNIEKFSATAPTVTDPDDATFNFGEVNGSLSVTATVDTEDEYTLSYQWYQNTTNSNEGGTAITDATSNTFNIPTDLNAGTYYYYCEATAQYTTDNASSTTASNAATVTIAKTEPQYTKPKNLPALIGQTLADIELPDGWTWDDPTTEIGELGTQTFPATFTPTDNTNYDNVNTELTVTVRKPLHFVDVPEGTYYYDPVYWAVLNGITNGTSETTYSPSIGTTRAQVLTFIWRLAGCPEPTTSECVFTDLEEEAYYYTAVLWGAENGITKGTSATTFSPHKVCSRAEIITLLWRYNGEQEPTQECGFADLKAGAYYEKAVKWASENHITKGYNETTFSPNDFCTRAQIVTFIYRANTTASN